MSGLFEYPAERPSLPLTHTLAPVMNHSSCLTIIRSVSDHFHSRLQPPSSSTCSRPVLWRAPRELLCHAPASTSGFYPCARDLRSRGNPFASKSDILDLVALENACFNTDFYRPHRFSWSQFASYLRNPRAIFFIAIQQGVLLGYIAGYRGARSQPVSARIESLAVAQAVQTRGMGGLLLRHSMEVTQRGCTRVTIEVAVANRSARRFFSHRGFKEAGRLTTYYDSQYDGIRMQREL